MSHDEVKNPFPGLRPFEFGDNHLFFGRDQQTTELTTRLRKNRFVAVVGTSGSGKSSLVRAGLMPELLSGTMAGVGSSWETTVMRPGGDPLTNLANAIVEADLYDSDEEDIASQIRATLTRSGLGLVEAMRQSELPEGTNFLLVVDQFEEIFRFRRSDDATDEQAAFFVNLLLEASAQADLPLYVIITMRSDFLGECSQFPRLADTVNEGEFLIPRLNRDQRKEAIVGPVKVAGGEIADRLLLRLLNDIGDDPDQLPILQHALMRTWDLFEERGGDGALDLEHYQATGGMGEALSRHADEVYGELPDAEHKRIAEKLFKSLTEKVDANRGIRRPMQLAELHEICGGEESHLRDVLDAFRKTGCTFLMPAGEAEIKTKTVIDISHESLMRAWRTLRNWVDEEAQSAKIYRRLADTATLYHEDKAGLYRDPDLQISLSWREESRPNKTWANRYYPGFESAMAFLDQSHEEAECEEREREEARQRELAQAKALAKARARSATIFKFACVGVTILAITAIFAMIDARKSRDEADRQIINLAKRSIATGEVMDAEDDHLGALVWYADAIRLAAKDSEIQSGYQAVFKTKLDNAAKLRYYMDIGEPLNYAALLPDGTSAVATTNYGNFVKNEENYLYLIDLKNEQKRIIQTIDGMIFGTKVNQNGTRLVLWEVKTKTLNIVELPSGQSILRRQFPLSFFGFPVFSDDGTYLLVGGNMQGRESMVYVINAETGKDVGVVNTEGTITLNGINAYGKNELSFSGNEAGFLGGNNWVHFIWNWEEKKLDRFSEIKSMIGRIRGSKKDVKRGNIIAYTADNSPNEVSYIQVFDQKKKALIHSSTKKGGGIFDFKLSPNLKFLAVGRSDGTIEMHDMDNLSLVWETNPEQIGAVSQNWFLGTNGSIFFSPDGFYLLATGGGNNIGIWEVVSGKIISSNLEFNGALLKGGWNKIGNSFFAGSASGELRVYEMPNQQGDSYLNASEFTAENSMKIAEALSTRFIDEGRMTSFNSGNTNNPSDLGSISNIYQHNSLTNVQQWHASRARAGIGGKHWSMVNYHYDRSQGFNGITATDQYWHLIAVLNVQQYDKGAKLIEQLTSKESKPVNNVPEAATSWKIDQWHYSGYKLQSDPVKAFNAEFLDVSSLDLESPFKWDAFTPLSPTGGEIRGLTEDDHLVDAPENSVYYVTKVFEVKEAGIYELVLDCDDLMKVWINGNVVHSYSQGGRGLQWPGRDMAVTWLDKGANSVLIKIVNQLLETGFYFELKESGGLSSSHQRQIQFARTGHRDLIADVDISSASTHGTLLNLAREASLYNPDKATLAKLKQQIQKDELYNSIFKGDVELNTSFLSPATRLKPDHFSEGLTLECFVKTSDRFAGHHILANGGSFNESGFSLMTHHAFGGVVIGELQNMETNEKVSIDAPFPFDDKWHHVALTYDPKSKKIHLYFDGKPASSPVSFESPLKFHPENLRVGESPHRRMGFYGGITDVRIWPVILGANVIAQHAQGSRTDTDVQPLLELTLRSKSESGELQSNNAYKVENVKWAKSDEPHPMEKGTDWAYAEFQYQVSDYQNEFAALGALEYRLGNHEKALELLVKACNDGRFSSEVVLFPNQVPKHIVPYLVMAYKKSGNDAEYERLRGVFNQMADKFELHTSEVPNEIDVLTRVELKILQKELNALAEK